MFASVYQLRFLSFWEIKFPYVVDVRVVAKVANACFFKVYLFIYFVVVFHESGWKAPLVSMQSCFPEEETSLSLDLHI